MTADIDQYFSVVGLFIIFRETIEASIIVSVLLQFLSRSFPQLKRQVWWGVAAGILVSVMFGIVFSILFYVAKQNLFTGNSKSIFKGVIAWFAGTLITILAFAMLRYRGWEDKLKRKLEGMAAKELEKQERERLGLPAEERPEPKTWLGRVQRNTGDCLSKALRPVTRPCCICWGAFANCVESCMIAVENVVGACVDKIEQGFRSCARCCHRAFGKTLPEAADKPKTPEQLVEVSESSKLVTRKHGWGIFLLVFSTVVREGIEMVVFLAGVGNAQPSSLPLPGLVGFVCGVGVGVFLYYTGRQVKDIKWFIIIMAIVLFFIAGGQFLLGTDFLQTGGMFGYASPWVNDRPWYMQPQWDLSSCCADTDQGNKFFALARAIFGYQDKPTFTEIMVYCGYWTFVILIALWKWWNGSLFDADYKYKRMMAREAKKRALEEQRAKEAELSTIDMSALSSDMAALEKIKLGALTTDADAASSGGGAPPLRTSATSGDGDSTGTPVTSSGGDATRSSGEGQAAPQPASSAPEAPTPMQVPEPQVASQQ